MTRRILVTEDSPTQAAALRGVLEAGGYDVVVARNGEEGLGLFEEQRCDAVISDIVMPGLVDGYELCRRIKAGQQRETPVILLTSLSDPLDIIRGLESGADNFFTKPYEAEHLLDRLKVLFSTREARAQAKVRVGIKIFFMGREFTIASDREQILDLLMSTFEDAVRQNRTLRKRETELETARAELARYAESLEAFSYSVSHDLRAPLRHMAGFAELLEKHGGPALDDKGRRYVDTIRTSAERMGRLIDDLLAFSRIGRTEVRRTRVPLDALVSEVVKEVQPDGDQRRVEWDVRRLPAVRGDPALLRQVFVNLLANALKYTSTREVARIEIDAREDVSGEVVVYVRDNGVGFDPRYAEKLFGVFQRLHSSDQFEGTGIGLANVRRIVTRHGGRVWAEGAVDQGATFYVALPAAGAE